MEVQMRKHLKIVNNMLTKNCSPSKSTPALSNSLKPKNYSSRSQLNTGVALKNNYINTEQSPSIAININLNQSPLESKRKKSLYLKEK